jgi:hypothetical protein
MSTSTISHTGCSSVARRSALDVMVERLARRMLAWSERPQRDRIQIDQQRFAQLADERVIASVRPVRWF